MIITKPNYQQRIDILNQAINSGKLSANDMKVAKNTIAGFLLEKQMAYDLDITFAKHEDILVLNDLKVEYNGKTAQVDHLVLTCYSAYFIESKSVAGSLQVNEYDEWTRWYGRSPTNIESPLLQSKRHDSILFDLLADNVDNFMGKILGLQKQLGSYTKHHYIAVSTKCNITGKGRGKYKDCLKKVDQISETILSFHKKHATGIIGTLLSNDNDKFKTMTNTELQAMGQFLLEKNIAEDNPLQAFNISCSTQPQPVTSSYRDKIQPVTPPEIKEKQAEYGIRLQTSICPDCKQQMEILWGNKYKNYYWKCQACGKNVSTFAKCPQCDTKMKIKKDKNAYYIYCQNCNIEGLYHQVKNHNSNNY